MISRTPDAPARSMTASSMRDQHLAALEREPLLADVVFLQERLEELGCIQLVDDPPLLLGVELRAVPSGLHPVEQPLADTGVRDVHELHADRAAVSFAQDGDQLVERGITRVAELVVENALQVGLGQTECGGLEQLERLVARLELQGVEIGQVMAELAIGVDQPRHGGLRTSRVEIERSPAVALGLET